MDDYSASFEDESFANLSDAERKKRFKSELNELFPEVVDES